jgi:hypothetical protein
MIASDAGNIMDFPGPFDQPEVDRRLDIGCIAAHGMFCCDGNGRYTITLHGKPATAFLFELIDRLQSSATVPMIDIQAYAAWLTR